MALTPVIARRSIDEKAQISNEFLRSTRRVSTDLQRHGVDMLLVPIVLVGLALRLAWMFTRSLVIENEGGEYAAIADHLLKGVGYAGQGQLPREPQLYFPPVYPGAIVLVSEMIRSTELAGRLVSLCMGVALIAVTYKLGTYMFGRRIGVLAGVLAAIHPLLVTVSVEVQSEAAYFALVLGTAYVALRAFESRRLREFILLGALCGLAYLTRPEAVLFIPPIIGAGVLVAVVERRRLGALAVGLASCCAVFFLLAAPYVAYLYVHTGLVRLETKTVVNLMIDTNMSAGQDIMQAQYGVSPSLQEYGAYMGDLDQRIIDQAGATSMLKVLELAPTTAPAQLRQLAAALRSSSFGGLPLLLLSAVGFFAGSWHRRRAYAQALLSSMLLMSIVSLFSLRFFYPRYALIMLPFLLLWAANALGWLDGALRAALQKRSGLLRLRRHLAVEHYAVAVYAAGLLLLAGRAMLTSGFDEWGGSARAAEQTRQAGLWLAQQAPDQKTVMDVGSAIPYYADAGYIELPYAAEDVALRYIDVKDPDYVVIRGELGGMRPYLGNWARDGIPNMAEHLVYDSGGPAEDRIRIYRWRSS